MVVIRLAMFLCLVMLVACSTEQNDKSAVTSHSVLMPVNESSAPSEPVSLKPTASQSTASKGESGHSDYLESNLVFEPVEMDAGSVLEGEPTTVYLRVRNAGSAMASIVSVTTSCGCTVAEPEQSLLMPGGFTRVKVDVDTFAKQDGVRKWVELTDDLGHRSRGWLVLDVKENPHLASSSRSIFDGKCASCHFTPAAGKTTGPSIYQAVCSMCHGANGHGAYAPKLAGYKDADVLAMVIAAGTGGRQMPGFARDHGGPLNKTQISALSAWLSTLD